MRSTVDVKNRSREAIPYDLVDLHSESGKYSQILRHDGGHVETTSLERLLILVGHFDSASLNGELFFNFKEAGEERGRMILLGASIDNSAVIAEGAVFAGSCIGKNSYVGHGTLVGPNVIIEEGALVGDNVRIGRNAWIHKGALIHSGAVLDPWCVIRENEIVY